MEQLGFACFRCLEKVPKNIVSQMVVKNTLDIERHLRFGMTGPLTYTTKTPNLKGYLPGYLGIVMKPMGSNPYPFSRRFSGKLPEK